MVSESIAREAETQSPFGLEEKLLIRLSGVDIDGKIILLKNNKATGPDGISPKLLKLAGPAVVAPVTSLFMPSIRECRVYNY